MLALFTDFGADDIYVGQVRVALLRHAAAGTPIIDVLHTAPNYNSQAGAHLLAALAQWYPPDSVFLGVVDPGVGSERDAVVLQADGQRFVGPDNGLLSVVAARAALTIRPAHAPTEHGIVLRRLGARERQTQQIAVAPAVARLVGT